MAELMVRSLQSSPFRLHPEIGYPIRTTSCIQPMKSQLTIGYHTLAVSSDRHLNWNLRGILTFASSQNSPSVTTNSDTNKGIGSEPDVGGRDGGTGGKDGPGGGSGGRGGRGGEGDSGNEGGQSSDDSKRLRVLSMSQKFTLCYAALVGVGGVMGYLKSGSQNSLLTGGAAAAILYYVYSELPTNPVFASSVGIVTSVALTGVMGSRFLRTGKVFPAGIVSVVSLVMAGGYLHGITRSAH